MQPATPVLVADVAALDATIAAMQALADAHGVALRPHAKGHRAPWVAERQLRAGAVGVAVASLAEAEIFLDAGLSDVLLTTVVAPQHATRVATLAGQGTLTVVVHDPGFVGVLEAAAAGAGVVLSVLVDLDVGQRRGGASTPEAALAVADAVAAAPHLRLRGVQGYDGHLQGLRDTATRAAGHTAAMARLDAATGALRGAGHVLEVVTTAGTGTAPLAAAHPGVTEIQPGSYALMDHTYAAVPGVGFTQAAHVLTTVTAVLAPDEVIVDAGARSVSTDAGPPLVDARPGGAVRWESAGDEHGRLLGAVADLRAGNVVRLIPSHTDTTVVLHGAVRRAP
jgi:D-serine deaminase-like pyridoxal phosphate-dependent protein